MRDFKRRLKVIWLVLTNQYTTGDKYQCWWLWRKEEDENIKVTFRQKRSIMYVCYKLIEPEGVSSHTGKVPLKVIENIFLFDGDKDRLRNTIPDENLWFIVMKGIQYHVHSIKNILRTGNGRFTGTNYAVGFGGTPEQARERMLLALEQFIEIQVRPK